LSSFVSSKWSHESHKNFSQQFQKRIFIFHLIIKRYQKKYGIRIPKPIISILINESLN
jgi:hypothetical protein